MLSFLLLSSSFCVASLIALLFLLYRQVRRPVDLFPPPPPPAFDPESERSIRRGFSHAFPSSPTAPSSPPFDVLVIGSGLSGLTCASLLSPLYRVLVLESHDVAGGCTHTWQSGDYPYAVGVHYCGGDLTDPSSPFRAVLDLVTAGRVRWSPTYSPDPPDRSHAHVYDVLHLGPRRLLVRAGTRRWLSSAIAQFPSDEAALRRYVRLTLDVNRQAQWHFILHALLPPWAYRLLAPLLVPTFRRYARLTTREVLAGLTASTALRSYLSYLHFDYGCLPQHSSFAAHAVAQCYFYRGTAYPVGGPSQLAKAAVAAIEARGGKVCVRCPVDSLIVEKGRVVGVRIKGREVRATTAVVSCVGARRTFLRLVREEDKGAVVREVAALEAQGGVQGVGLGQAAAHFSLFFSFEGDAATLAIPLHNTFVLPDDDVDGAGARWAGPGAGRTVEEVGVQGGPPVGAVFITFASRKDPTATERAPGVISGQVLAEGRFEWVEGERGVKGEKRGRGKGYGAMKRRVQALLLGQVLEAFPQLRGCRLLHSELGTPLSSEQWLGAEQGSSYGMTHSVERVEAEWLRCGGGGVEGAVPGGDGCDDGGVGGGDDGGGVGRGGGGQAGAVAAPQPHRRSAGVEEEGGGAEQRVKGTEVGRVECEEVEQR